MSQENRPVIWSRPGCVACRQTKKVFEKLGVEPDERMVDDEQVAKLSARGFRALPVVEWRGEVWSGFRPDRIAV